MGRSLQRQIERVAFEISSGPSLVADNVSTQPRPVKDVELYKFLFVVGSFNQC